MNKVLFNELYKSEEGLRKGNFLPEEEYIGSIKDHGDYYLVTRSVNDSMMISYLESGKSI